MFELCRKNRKDYADMLKQLRSLYTKANRITLCLLLYCRSHTVLIKSYCTSDYKASTFCKLKLRVAFKNV